MATGDTHDIHFMMTEFLNMFDKMVNDQGDLLKNSKIDGPLSDLDKKCPGKKPYEIDPNKMDDDDYMLLASSRKNQLNPNLEGLIRNYYRGDIEAAIAYKNTPTYNQAAIYMLWIFNQLGFPYEIGKLLFEWQNIANINVYSWVINTKDSENCEHSCGFVSPNQTMQMLVAMHESDGKLITSLAPGSYQPNYFNNHQYRTRNLFHVMNLEIELTKRYIRDEKGRLLWKFPMNKWSVINSDFIDKKLLRRNINIHRQEIRGNICDEATQNYISVPYVIGMDGQKLYNTQFNTDTNTFSKNYINDI